MPYVAERDEIVVRLERIYANYDERPEGALDRHEDLIVTLVNRYHQLSEWIARFDEVTTRRSNIAAGRALLETIRKGQS